jgi:hypothetical protein
MDLQHEADALREKVDDLALGPASLEDWRLADARLFAALVEGRSELVELQRRMCELAESHHPDWSWFQVHARTRELVELLDDLCVLRMCVQSRICEIFVTAAETAACGRGDERALRGERAGERPRSAGDDRSPAERRRCRT